jgi:hypothetical protein
MVMPLSVEFAEGGQLLACAGTGAVTADEVLGAARSVLAQPGRVRDLVRCVVVFAADADLQLSSAEAREVARVNEELAALAPGLAVALVAPADHAFGVSRMWEALAAGTGWRIHVFRDRADADAWHAGAAPPR